MVEFALPLRLREGYRLRAGLARAARLACAGALVLALLMAARSPLMPGWLLALALVTLAAAAWRPALVFPWVVVAAPFGELAAAVPIRATETVLAAFFAGWLLRVHEPLDPGRRVPRFVALPALAFAAVAIASWMAIVAERSVGLSAGAFARQFVRMLEYLVTAGRDPQTAAMLRLLLMVAICFSVPALSRHHHRLAWHVALAVAAAGLLAATATLGLITLGYAQTGDANLIARHFEFRAWRYSVHLDDLNAAGSHYALAGLTAMAFVQTRRWRRLAWCAGLLLIAAALWMTASRIALLAAVAGVGGWIVLMALRPRETASAGRVPDRSMMVVPTVVTCAALIGGMTVWMVRAANQGNDPGVSLREGFLMTSARMISSAPTFGVGVGMYYQRSREFMPPVVLNAYPGGENAHNYFAQVTAELGIVGGALFLWWIAAILSGMWRTARAGPAPALDAALLAGCGAYLITCIAGHPLLVVETTVPFWAATGAGLACVPRADAEDLRATPREGSSGRVSSSWRNQSPGGESRRAAPAPDSQ